MMILYGYRNTIVYMAIEIILLYGYTNHKCEQFLCSILLYGYRNNIEFIYYTKIKLKSNVIAYI